VTEPVATILELIRRNTTDKFAGGA
jgi:hypothetical protein